MSLDDWKDSPEAIWYDSVKEYLSEGFRTSGLSSHYWMYAYIDENLEFLDPYWGWKDESVKIELYHNVVGDRRWYFIKAELRMNNREAGDYESETFADNLNDWELDAENIMNLSKTAAKTLFDEYYEARDEPIDLASFENTDYQNRRGDYPRSGRPDAIFYDDYDNSLIFSFKDTPRTRVKSWVESWLANNFLDDKVADMSWDPTDSEYPDDWNDLRVVFAK